MNLSVREFIARGFWPREDLWSSANFNDHFDVAYAVWSSDLPSRLAQDQRFNLVFLHGAQFCKEIWNYFIELCFECWGEKLDKCVTIDAVNHGKSAVLNRHKLGYYASWADHARDDAKVIHQLHADKEIAGPVIVIGHSMGGAQALFLGSLDPGIIDGIVTMDPVWLGPDVDLNDLSIFEKSQKIVDRVFDKTQDLYASEHEYMEYMKTHFPGRKVHPRIFKDLAENIASRNHDGTVTMHATRVHQAVSYFGIISSIIAGPSIFRYTRIPTLVVHGDIADWNYDKSNEDLVKILPFSKSALVKGGGHLVFFEKPLQTLEAFKDFVTERYEAALKSRQQFLRRSKLTFDKKDLFRELKQIADSKTLFVARL